MFPITFIKDEEGYVSECCFAYPAFELDMSSAEYGGPSGFCSRCQDNAIFLVEDSGEPFDTKEEKYGER
jgi:hypothetical protein|tara:strand:+ start:737 stop:943 length:207 start_codon:yes stop_codon:yes gene_type:complete